MGNLICNRTNSVKEIWKDIKGYEGLYQVSNTGKIRRIKTKENVLKQNKNKNGYRRVTLSKNNIHKTYSVHRLVAETFIPNPSNLSIINHKDENPSNNFANNLEWCTQQYNINYGLRNKKVAKKLTGIKRKPHTKEWKAIMNRKMTNNHKLSKKVLCVEINAIYPSISEASRKNNIGNSHIVQVCKGYRETAGGYHWRYVYE